MLSLIAQEAQRIRDASKLRGDNHHNNEDSFARAVNNTIEYNSQKDSKGQKYITAEQWRELSVDFERRSGGRAGELVSYERNPAGYYTSRTITPAQAHSAIANKESVAAQYSDYRIGSSSMVTNGVMKKGDSDYKAAVRDTLNELGGIWQQAEIAYVMGFIPYGDQYSIQHETEYQADQARWQADHPYLQFVGEVFIEAMDGFFGEPDQAYAPGTHDPYETLFGSKPDILNGTSNPYTEYIQYAGYINPRKLARKGGKEALGFIEDVVKRKGKKAEKAVVESAGNATKWVDEAGNIKWRANDGFAGKPTQVTLQPGTKIDRYGYEGGSYASPAGTPYGQRSLAPGTENKPYTVYEVVKPIDAQGGKAAPWFDQPGGGTQYKFNMTIEELKAGGYIREVGR